MRQIGRRRSTSTRRHTMCPVNCLLMLALVASLFGPLAVPRPARAVGLSLHGIRVEGNQLVNGAGQVVRLHGVNRSGTEYACIQGWGIFDGPTDDAALQSIKAWHTNAVRVPLN